MLNKAVWSLIERGKRAREQMEVSVNRKRKESEQPPQRFATRRRCWTRLARLCAAPTKRERLGSFWRERAREEAAKKGGRAVTFRAQSFSGGRWAGRRSHRKGSGDAKKPPSPLPFAPVSPPLDGQLSCEREVLERSGANASGVPARDRESEREAGGERLLLLLPLLLLPCFPIKQSKKTAASRFPWPLREPDSRSHRETEDGRSRPRGRATAGDERNTALRGDGAYLS